MASKCPCGCDRRVDFDARCLAKRSLYIASLVAVPERCRMLARSEAERDDWHASASVGLEYADTLLAIAHGKADALMYEPGHLDAFRRAADAWEARTLLASRRLSSRDGKWHARWGGPSYRTRSMSEPSGEI